MEWAVDNASKSRRRRHAGGMSHESCRVDAEQQEALAWLERLARHSEPTYVRVDAIAWTLARTIVDLRLVEVLTGERHDLIDAGLDTWCRRAVRHVPEPYAGVLRELAAA